MADDELPEIIDLTPAAAPEPEPAPEKPVEAAAEPDDTEDPPEQRKDPVAQLKGRVGHLTKSLHQKDAEIARLTAAAAAKPGEVPAGDALETAKAQVRAEQAEAAFAAECNEVFDKGKAEFADEFAESIAVLNSTGIMQRPLIEAALATGDAAKVLHFLGQDLDAAQRIAEMHPIKMAAEMTKLAVRLAGTKARTSNAPAPIKPLGGAAKTEPDIYDPDLSDDDYYARRKKQGNAPWLQ